VHPRREAGRQGALGVVQIPSSTRRACRRVSLLAFISCCPGSDMYLERQMHQNRFDMEETGYILRDEGYGIRVRGC
jgi:hypothetical protein